jgi:NIMA (never in mitosis gene a)-related kinase 10
MYAESPDDNIKTQHEIQLHCLRCLRFMYSVEKNRKTFKIIFPPSLFGAFIDVGNFNNEFRAYIPLLKMLNKKTSVEQLQEIQNNFNSMGNF